MSNSCSLRVGLARTPAFWKRSGSEPAQLRWRFIDPGENVHGQQSIGAAEFPFHILIWVHSIGGALFTVRHDMVKRTPWPWGGRGGAFFLYFEPVNVSQQLIKLRWSRSATRHNFVVMKWNLGSRPKGWFSTKRDKGQTVTEKHNGSPLLTK